MANPRKFRPLEYVMESQMSCDICMGTGWGDLEGHPCGCPVGGYDPDPDFAKLFDLYLYLVSDMSILDEPAIPDPIDDYGRCHACNCDLGYGECIECLREQGRITNDQRA